LTKIIPLKGLISVLGELDMDLKKIRQDLHRIPELGFKEFKTQNYIHSIVKHYMELKSHFFDFPGIIYQYQNGAGPYTLFRADMDALSLQEETGCSFQSEHPGLMHACGHDLHMTILIGLIQKVIREKPLKNILFLFQPAEEGKGGAQKVLETGVLDKFKISRVFALHVNGTLPLGTIASRPEIFFAAAQEVNVEFKGISAHVAFPEKGKNALAAGVMFYDKLKQRMSLEYPETDAALVEFGKMTAGTVMNAIAGECKLEGTVRAFKNEDLKFIKKLIEITALQSAEKFQLEFKIEYGSYYRQVKNDAQLVELLEAAADISHLKYLTAEKVFTGEDFGFLTHRYKGLLFWLGTNLGENADLHSSNFLPSAEVIPKGIDIFWNLLNSK
jgi:N-acetyldiaminopimelate deacetylase